MPIGKYLCENCNHITEILQKELPETIQYEKCGSIAKKQIPQGVGIIFKSGGFYKTSRKGEKHSEG